MKIFPTLDVSTLVPDQSYSEIETDPSMSQEMEGGYEITRPAHTRAPTKEFSFTIPYATTADKDLLQAFWASTKGKSEMFEWVNFITQETHVVRFKDQIAYDYAGFGTYAMWETTISLKEV